MLQNLPASSRLAEDGKGRTKDPDPLDQAVGGLNVALSTSTNRKTVRSQRFVVYYLICTWEAVSQFLEQNLGTFAGRVAEAESTIMPSSRAWLRDLIQENTTSVDCGVTKKNRKL